MEKSILVEQTRNDIAWIKQELQKPDSVLHGIYSSNSPKKDLLLHWATLLERQHELGEFIEPVSNISTFIKKELKQLHLDSAVFYVHEILPPKYKKENLARHNEEEDDLIGEDDPSRFSSDLLKAEEKELAQKCQKENKSYIFRLTRTIDNLTKMIQSLSTDKQLVSQIDKDELEQHYITWDQYNTQLEEVMDGRNKVLPSKQHIFLYYLTTSNLGYAYEKYTKHLKEFGTLTSKQASKISRGMEAKMELLYEPKNQMEARAIGMYGVVSTMRILEAEQEIQSR